MLMDGENETYLVISRISCPRQKSVVERDCACHFCFHVSHNYEGNTARNPDFSAEIHFATESNFHAFCR
jgi:hypothetical protein